MMKYFDRTSSVRILEHTEEAGVMGLEEDAVAYNALAHAHKRILDYAFAQQYLKTPRTGKILDIGTGPGLIPIYMVQQNPHLNIVAIDPSPKMIELAYQNAKEAGVEGKILFDIATSNQYEKGFFDHVFSHHVMHHFEHPEHLILEAIRTTKPQGTIHIRDLKRPATFGGIDFFVDFLGGPVYKNRRYRDSTTRCNRI
jgi:2-polyprenyl-3-methyl-5-hydroxy-6-metoxy-1,4-benzoquinol methylase